MAALSRIYLGTSPVQAGASGSISFSSQAMASATSSVAWIFQAQEACTITQLGFRATTRIGTPPTYRISLQGVSSGSPDGTIKSATNAKKTFTPPASTAWNGTWQWLTLDSSYACTRGELLAIVVDYSTGTVDASNALSMAVDSNGFFGRAAFPYGISTTAGTPTRSGQFPIYGYTSSTTTYGQPWSAFNAVVFSSTSTPDEYALRFKLPAGFGSKFAVAGVRIHGGTSVAAKTFLVQLFEGTTLKQSIGTWDSDDLRVNAQDANVFDFLFTDTDLQPLTPGVEHFLSLAGNDVTQNISLLCAQANSAQDAAVNGGGEYYLATRSDAGAWSPDLTQRPLVDIILADLTPAPVASALLATRASTY
jgi:hypothetical protein